MGGVQVDRTSRKRTKAMSSAWNTPAARASVAGKSMSAAGLPSSYFARDPHRRTEKETPDPQRKSLINPWLMDCKNKVNVNGSETSTLEEALEIQMGEWMLKGKTGRQTTSRPENGKEVRLAYSAAPAVEATRGNGASRDDNACTVGGKGTTPITRRLPSSRTGMLFQRSARGPFASVSSAPSTCRAARTVRACPERDPAAAVVADNLHVLASISLAPDVWGAEMLGSLAGAASQAGKRKRGGDYDGGASAGSGKRRRESTDAHPARTIRFARNYRGKAPRGAEDSLRKETRIWNRRHMWATEEGGEEACSYCGRRPEGGLMFCSAREAQNVHTICFPCLEKDGITKSDLARGRVKWEHCLKCDELPDRRCSGRSRSKPKRFREG